MAKKKRQNEIEESVANEEIKKMESEMRENSIKSVKPVSKVIKPNKVTFDTWFFIRSKAIPKRHAKEIIIVDFKARGLKNEETMEIFDEALNKYGVKL